MKWFYLTVSILTVAIVASQSIHAPDVAYRNVQGNINKVVNIMTYGASPSKTALQNSAAIDSARKYAKSIGGMLYVPAGTFQHGKRIIIDWDNGGIYGPGVLQRADSFNIAYTYSGYSGSATYAQIVLYNAKNIVVEDITIDSYYRSGNQAGPGSSLIVDSCSNVLIRNVRTIRSTGTSYNFWVRRSHSVTYDNCYASGDRDGSHAPVGYTANQELFEVSQGSIWDITYSNCIADSGNQSGFYLYDADAAKPSYGQVRNIRYLNCTARNSQYGWRIWKGTDDPATDLSHIQILGGACENDSTGISVNGANLEPLPNHISIQGMSFRDCWKSIDLNYARDMEVQNTMIDNTLIDGNAYAGIYSLLIDRILIGGNKITGGKSQGITITSLTRNFQVVNNYIYNTGRGGIYCNGKVGILSSNLVYNCNADSNTNNIYGSGIILNSCDSVTVTGNRIVDDRVARKYPYSLYANGAQNSYVAMNVLDSSWNATRMFIETNCTGSIFSENRGYKSGAFALGVTDPDSSLDIRIGGVRIDGGLRVGKGAGAPDSLFTVLGTSNLHGNTLIFGQLKMGNSVSPEIIVSNNNGMATGTAGTSYAFNLGNVTFQNGDATTGGSVKGDSSYWRTLKVTALLIVPNGNAMRTQTAGSSYYFDLNNVFFRKGDGNTGGSANIDSTYVRSGYFSSQLKVAGLFVVPSGNAMRTQTAGSDYYFDLNNIHCRKGDGNSGGSLAADSVYARAYGNLPNVANAKNADSLGHQAPAYYQVADANALTGTGTGTEKAYFTAAHTLASVAGKIVKSVGAKTATGWYVASASGGSPTTELYYKRVTFDDDTYIDVITTDQP